MSPSVMTAILIYYNCEISQMISEKYGMGYMPSLRKFVGSATYPAYKGSSADKVLAEWDEFGLTDFIYGMYERYYIDTIENAYEDIDKLILERRQ